MFQSFKVKSDGAQGPARVARLRALMDDTGIDAFIVPHSDPHQNEYLPERDERLAWLTGFTGSAGTAMITHDKAVILVDGRYTLQAREQVDDETFEISDLVNLGVAGWIKEQLPKKTRLAYDPWMHTQNGVARLTHLANNLGIDLIALDQNPIDQIWSDQPTLPQGDIVIQRKELAGVTVKRKLRDLQKVLRAQNADAVILTDPTSTSWLFNIRGNQIAHTPLVLSWTIVPRRGMAQLFADTSNADIETQAYLTQLADLHPYGDFAEAVDALGQKAKSIMVDPTRVANAIFTSLEAGGASLIKAADPCALPRACKNRTELKGAANAHERDGVAMVHFLAWLDAQEADDLDEISVVQKLEACRSQTGTRLDVPLRDISFDTICGSGPNGAIVHYRVTEQSNRQMKRDELLLVDSGAQYEDGTTDITRVIPLGDPRAEHKKHFTLVLKGMIAISMAKFPCGTRGSDLDPLARRALWDQGLDYGHGTGHGIGSYLAVHEGPQSISKRGAAPLETGMILSNEPGYYKTGSYGIRIENLVYVKPAKVPTDGEVPVHSFQTLTLCPIDRRLVEGKLLSKEERQWLNRYHARVRRMLSPLIEDQSVRLWLDQATARI
ncbi:MAG: aminopeptidase P family protein [Pseudomonadota bacterium]